MRAASGPSGPRAGFWQRFGALILDIIVLIDPGDHPRHPGVGQTAGQVLAFLVDLAYFTYF